MQRSLLSFFAKPQSAPSTPAKSPVEAAKKPAKSTTAIKAAPPKPVAPMDAVDDSPVSVAPARRKRRMLDDDELVDASIAAECGQAVVPSTPSVSKKQTSQPTAKKAKAKPNKTKQSDDDDADEAFHPDAMSESDDDAELGEPEYTTEVEASDDGMEEDVPVKTPKKQALKPSVSTVKKSPSTPSLTSPTLKRTPSSNERAKEFAKKNEDRYKWLENIRDANGRPTTHPEYDPTTLHIPKEAFEKLTAFEKQFWEIKRTHFDTVVFFKKGKFYELYESDAHIGHKELDLKMTDRVNMNMAGVPENSFDHWAAKLIARGYKVGRVEQVESKLAASARGTGAKAIISRELKQVLTAGTLVDEALIGDYNSAYLMAVAEDAESGHYGICFVDSSTGRFRVSFIEDDQHRTKFETLVVQIRPKEFVFAKNGISAQALSIVKRHVVSPIINYLKPDTEFWTAEKTAEKLVQDVYFGDDEWPACVREARDSKPLVLSAIGGCVSYLNQLKLDVELVSLKNFDWYDAHAEGSMMVLDGATLSNLEILQNSDGGVDGTLFKLLNQCQTPFGKRLFRQWLCHPLRRIADINDRLDAIDDLNARSDLVAILASGMQKLPDLERMISRIHAGTMKLPDFLIVLESFRKVSTMFEKLQEDAAKFKSRRLRAITTFDDVLPDLRPLVQFFNEAFDQQEAKKEGVIMPKEGMVADYDRVQAKIVAVEKKLKRHLSEQREYFGSENVKYKDINKELYQIEVPVSALKGVTVTNEYSVMSQTKEVKRFWTPFIREQMPILERAKEERTDILKDVLFKMLAKFDEHFMTARRAVDCIAELDCLLCLARNSKVPGVCRPVFVDSAEPVLELQECRHPCMEAMFGSFVPNDIALGGTHAATVILTGPNMGGKSTLLRQTCVAVIMAQLGCYVPAVACKLSPVDRIFTRVGASDRILAGQSTFMVELYETSNILRNATKQSLVILDELGRGTSTYDGYAIAYAVIDYMTRATCCRALFSTHYHNLCTELAENSAIALFHMDCLVDDEKREVTFLYKLKTGDCPKSYGMHVASMAGVPESVVARAEMIAAEFEKTSAFARLPKSPAKSAGAAAGGDGDAMEVEPPLTSTERSMLRELAMLCKPQADPMTQLQNAAKLIPLWVRAKSVLAAEE
eukprot:TRINITY_DN13445_c0_g1_i1.p1 TRINITY_DN13445_c0_g1~~TRINITY_DN13445_c0_g1_i1.p1  ORF type:complete len:1151 (+),score=299.87 TRINITY_DN13445_c0_g1_i1:80-3532(+)